MISFTEYLAEAKLTKRLEKDMGRHFFQVLHDAMGNLVKIDKKLERDTPSGFTLASIAAWKAGKPIDSYSVAGSDLVDSKGSVVLASATAGKYTIEDWISAVKKH